MKIIIVIGAIVSFLNSVLAVYMNEVHGAFGWFTACLLFLDDI